MGIVKNLASHQLYFWSYIAVLLLFPWWLRGANCAMAVMLVAGLWSSSLDEKVKKLKEQPLVFIFLIFYCLYLAGLFYSENIFSGIKSVEQKLVMIIFPLLAVSSASFSVSQRKIALLNFASSSLLLTLVCLVLNVTAVIHGGPFEQVNFDPYNLSRFNALHPEVNPIWMQMTYLSFTKPLINSPTYLSLFIIFSILIFLYTRTSTLLPSLLKYGVISWLCVSVILLSSRMGIFILFGVLGIYFIHQLWVSTFFWKQLAGPMCLLISLISLTLLSPVTRYRVIEEPLATGMSIPYDSTQWNSVNLRMLQWKSGIQGVKQNGFGGTGTGASNEILQQYYAQANLGGFDRFKVVHNQYLETYLEIGVAGFIALTLCFAIPAFVALKQKNYLALYLIGIVCLCCISTSLFDSGRGLTFYMSLISLLLFTKHESNEIS
jgi:O-antigen ligase